MKEKETKRHKDQPILKPPAKGEITKHPVYVEGARLLNPLRITEVYACGNMLLKDAVNALNAGRDIPWADIKLIPPTRITGEKISDNHFVLLIDYPAAQFMDPQEFRKNNPKAIVVLLSSSAYIGSYPPGQSEKDYPYVRNADFVFYIGEGENAPTSIIPAAIRCAEDKLNIEKYSHEKRFVFLVVDDEPRWFSQFLPVLYRIIGQRADVAIARSYEQAEEFIRERGDSIVCLISDIYIPRAGSVGPHGKELVLCAKGSFPRIPVIIASKSAEGKELESIALITPKGDPGSLEKLEQYVRDFTGMGDFLFYEGHELKARAATLLELLNRIERLPTEVLEKYAKQDLFSTWFYMHGFEKLGDILRPRQDRGEVLRTVLVQSIYEALACAADESFLFHDDFGNLVTSAESPIELAKCIETLEVGLVERYSHYDAFSAWLMRKGYVNLADDLRPLHGEGEELRKQLLDIFANHGLKP